MKKGFLILPILLSFFFNNCLSQPAHLSISTDFNFQRSFKKEQRYWSVGQTIQGLFNFLPQEGIYVLFSYYANGKFHNNLAATAKGPNSNPQQISFINNSLMRYKHLSFGWKHFLKGSFDNEDSWNLYGYAGFGLMMGRVTNSFSAIIDTANYSVPVNKGKANFKRLTCDLGLGWEVLLGSGIYFYNEARVEIPTTDYPSPYLFVNENAPLMASVNFGLRILFD